MADTGNPWFIPFAEPSDLVRDWPALSSAVATAVADGLSSAGFNASTTITATDASWPVPTLANPFVKVTVIGGGGGGGRSSGTAGAGGTTTFNAGTAGTQSASGGAGGDGSGNLGADGGDGWRAGNGGQNYHTSAQNTRGDGQGGQVRVVYFNLTGISTANVTVGAGGAGGDSSAGSGGRGEVIVEYVAG
jgi:hypothetical protein